MLPQCSALAGADPPGSSPSCGWIGTPFRLSTFGPHALPHLLGLRGTPADIHRTQGGLIMSCSRTTRWESLRSRTLLSSKAFEETLGKTKCLWGAPVPFQEHRCSSPFGLRHSPKRLSVECSSNQLDERLIGSVCLPTPAPLRKVHKDLSRTQSVSLLRLVACLSATFPPHRWSFIPQSLVVFQLGWVIRVSV